MHAHTEVERQRDLHGIKTKIIKKGTREADTPSQLNGLHQTTFPVKVYGSLNSVQKLMNVDVCHALCVPFHSTFVESVC